MNATPAGSFGSASPLPINSAVAEPDRREENRRPVQTKATLVVLDGPLAETSYEVVTRDLSLSGLSFLLREALPIGQNCRIDLQTPAGVTSHQCEVIRARVVSRGRHEIAVQFRGK